MLEMITKFAVSTIFVYLASGLLSVWALKLLLEHQARREQRLEKSVVSLHRAPQVAVANAIESDRQIVTPSQIERVTFHGGYGYLFNNFGGEAICHRVINLDQPHPDLGRRRIVMPVVKAWSDDMSRIEALSSLSKAGFALASNTLPLADLKPVVMADGEMSDRDVDALLDAEESAEASVNKVDDRQSWEGVCSYLGLKEFNSRDQNEKPSEVFCARIGKIKVWGKDLERAFVEAGATLGDRVQVIKVGKVPVVVDVVLTTGKKVEKSNFFNQYEVIKL